MPIKTLTEALNQLKRERSTVQNNLRTAENKVTEFTVQLETLDTAIEEHETALEYLDDTEDDNV